MALFDKYPLRYYQFGDREILFTNLLKRVKLHDSIKETVNLYFEYNIKDSDTPESISYKIYDEEAYYYIIFMTNDIYDPYCQWPLNSYDLDDKINNVYGSDKNDVHHYESKDGYIVSENHPSYDRLSVTNYEYEVGMNDEKRKIKLLKPEYTDIFNTEMDTLLKI